MTRRLTKKERAEAEELARRAHLRKVAGVGTLVLAALLFLGGAAISSWRSLGFGGTDPVSLAEQKRAAEVFEPIRFELQAQDPDRVGLDLLGRGVYAE